MGALDGELALVTGSSAGLWLETCVKLARLGAHVAMVARNGSVPSREVDSPLRRAMRGPPPTPGEPAVHEPIPLEFIPSCAPPS